MVTADDEDVNAVLAQAFELAANMSGCVEVDGVTVIEVASDQNKSDLFLDRQFHHVVKRGTRGDSDLVGKLSAVPPQIQQRAVKMNVGGVDECDMVSVP